MRTTALSLALPFLGAVALPLAPSRALADEFQDHVDRAGSLSHEEHYKEALAELRAAYAIRSSPRLRYRIAQAEQRLGDVQAALSTYEAFLADAPHAEPDVRADAEAQIAKLRRLTSLPSPVPMGAPLSFTARDEEDIYRITTDGGDCFTPCRIYLPPGPRRAFTVGDGAFALHLDIPVQGGQVRVQQPWTGMLKSGVALTMTFAF